MSQVYYIIDAGRTSPRGGSMPSGRPYVSNPCPARYARHTKTSDTKGSRAMQYCPEDSSAVVERGVAERIAHVRRVRVAICCHAKQQRSCYRMLR